MSVASKWKFNTWQLAGALFVIAILRGSFAGWDSIWAEDGRVFIHEVLNEGRFFQIFHPYAGYIHSVPRAIASLVTLLQIEAWSIAITMLTGLIATVIGLAIFLATESLGLSVKTRLAISLITVLAPSVANEVLGNLANLHTLFLWSAPWVFIVQPKNFKQSWLWALYIFFAATTEIQLIYFAPLLLWNLKNLKRLPLLIGAFVGLTFQALVALSSDRTNYFDMPSFTNLFDGFLLQAALTGWVGVMYVTRAIIKNFGIWIAYLAIIPSLVATYFIIKRSKNKEFNFFITFLWFALIVVWTFGFAINNIDIAENTLAHSFQMRHATVPAMLMISFVVIYFDRRFNKNIEFELLLKRATVFMLSLITIGTFAIGALGTRSHKNLWSEQVGKAKEACQSSPSSQNVTIPISPNKPAGWAVTVPCEKVLT